MNVARGLLHAAEDSLSDHTIQQIEVNIEQLGYTRIRGLSDSFDHVSELSRLGSPIPQYDGEYVRDIRPDPNLQPGVYSALSTDELNPHTEWYEFPGAPPRFVALWCVSPVRGQGGETTIADGYEFLKNFSAEEIELLHRRRYKWYGLPTYQATRPAIEHPVLEIVGGRTVIRYSNQYVERRADGLMPRYIDEGKQFFVAKHTPFALLQRELLIWDNWRMIHARNAFTDRHRHMRRILLG
jgi:alpha-ketoglutarate-dependent taurine dioxygenase